MDNSKVKEGYATVGPYPTTGVAVKVSTALSMLAMFLVIVLGYFFVELKSDQEVTDRLVHETNEILREIAQDVRKGATGE